MKTDWFQQEISPGLSWEYNGRNCLTISVGVRQGERKPFAMAATFDDGSAVMVESDETGSFPGFTYETVAN